MSLQSNVSSVKGTKQHISLTQDMCFLLHYAWLHNKKGFATYQSLKIKIQKGQ